MELGYQYLDYNKIKVYMCQFCYKYDHRASQFRILNDASNYVIANMEIDFLEDSDLYNFIIMDEKIVKVKEDPVTKELVKESEKMIDPAEAMTYDFDVDRVGAFLGMQDAEEMVTDTFKHMGIKPDPNNKERNEQFKAMIEF